MVLKIAYNFVNDSFRSTVCLFYSPQVIAMACLEIAQMYLATELPDHNDKPWYHYVDDKIDKEEVDAARTIISSIYAFFKKE